MNLKTIALAAAVSLLAVSCSSKKQTLPYFDDISTVATGEFPAMQYLTTIQPDDELYINVSSEHPAATVAYNLPFTNPAASDVLTKTSTPRTQTYRVDSKGDINFPVLGTLHVAGMNIEQLQAKLTELISKDVKNPVVNVGMVNFSVVVAGEVKIPQSIPVSGNRITVLEALAKAGDLTEYGRREDVLVVREENGKRVFAHLDLTKSDVFNSPYYYLQPNDYVYVAPNDVLQANSKYNQNNAFKLSVISTIVSAASVIASLVIALTVK